MEADDRRPARRRRRRRRLGEQDPQAGGLLAWGLFNHRVEAGLADRPWPTLAKAGTFQAVRVNVGQAKTDLSKLLARVEAGEEVEIARDGVPVARLVRVEPSTPGSRFLATYGTLAGSIVIGDDFEFSDAEIEAMLDEPA